MTKISTFEDLYVWQESVSLSIDTYKLLVNCKDFGFKDQITRATVSIPSNIAEGFERNSDKEFSRYLKIAKGSAGEVRTQLYIGKSVGILKEDEAKSLIEKCLSISRKLQALITSCEIKILKSSNKVIKS